MKIRLIAAAQTVAMLALAPAVAHADEGMWTYDNFPAAAVKEKYGAAIDQAWLDRTRNASVRLSSGCSASFVTPEGLIATNWHCSVGCAQNLSDAQHDYVGMGFTTKGRTEERACPGMQADVLVSIEDVTPRIKAAMEKAPVAERSKARDAESAKVESEACGDAADKKCEVVSLYRGGQYKLYRYKTYTDVRLAFIPEQAVGFFGGDPDNFNFPRYNLDVSFLRAYENGKPAATPAFLPWRTEPLKAGELTLVSGNPGSTSRLLTMSQLNFLRDWSIHVQQLVRSQLRGRLYAYSASSPEAKREAAELIFSIENSYKASYGRERALADPAFMTTKAAEEAALRKAVAADPALAKDIGDPWADIDKAVAAQKELYLENDFLEARAGSVSPLYGWARALVRGADERAKPNAERLPEFTDSRLKQAQQVLLAPVPAPAAIDKIGLTVWLQQTREFLTVDHPAVKALLGKESPEGLAERLVSGSKLADPKVREALWKGGKAAIDASDDPMIRFVAANDARARAVREEWRKRVSGPVADAAERIARARFAVYGDKIYPDATFTLRLSYGAVDGWTYNGETVPPFTQMGGVFDRATGAEPFVLPQRWLDAKAKINPATTFDVSTTQDIIGGNSGSPLIDAKGQIVGLIFDGNIHSLGGDYGYDGRTNRAVSVTTPAITEALTKIYGMDNLTAELAPAKGKKKH